MKEKSDNLIMVFVRNPVLGKVKTRMAKKIGNKTALQIYKMLLLYTEKVVYQTRRCDRAVFYSDFIEKEDIWHDTVYQKYVQEGNDLGERIKNAFSLAFSKGYKNVIIIGSDCVEVTEAIFEDAFLKLNSNEVVIGPANDGGYYLLGIKSLHKELFENILWSTENVLLDTMNVCKNLNLKYFLLPSLSDVDTEESIKDSNGLKI